MAVWNTKRTCFGFLIFFDLDTFWGSFWWQKKSENWHFLAQNNPKRGPNSKNIKNPKHKFFVFQNASFLPKIRNYGQNRDEFYCLEANFQTPQIPGFPIHLTIFREIRRFMSRHHSNLFQFRKQFLNPHSPNFKYMSKLKKIIFWPWTPLTP